MATKVVTDLGDVQKTMLLPLWGRAVESGKTRAQLIDPMAVQIIQQMDFDFSKLAQNLDQLTQIAWIKRSLICDRTIKAFLERNPEGTVVNIGCGLDTTFERTDNGMLRWYDLDMPDVIELRRKFISETERRTFITASFLDPDWLSHIEVRGNVLFIAAGVFYYFSEAEIKGFVLRLLDKFPNSELLFDVSSPTGVRVANKRVIESAGLDQRSYLKWGLKDKHEVLAWDEKIELLGAYYYFRTLRLSVRNLILGTLSDILGIQYMLHLKLGGI